jgi:ribosomal subunit interface protein
MTSNVSSRHVDITPALRQMVDQKLAKLERLLQENALSANVVLSQERHRCRAEMTVHVRGDHFLHGEDEGGQWSLAIGGAVDKVQQQAHALKTRWERRRRVAVR